MTMAVPYVAGCLGVLDEKMMGVNDNEDGASAGTVVRR